MVAAAAEQQPKGYVLASSHWPSARVDPRQPAGARTQALAVTAVSLERDLELSGFALTVTEPRRHPPNPPTGAVGWQSLQNGRRGIKCS